VAEVVEQVGHGSREREVASGAFRWDSTAAIIVWSRG
jgi:hypothetical protein